MLKKLMSLNEQNHILSFSLYFIFIRHCY